ncbi:WASH complex subunit 3 [Histomonas meleagridis]|uniref:WASH complex subunit 3 n=1 Tax=Histomonas meleagridis TaxID=135588 RepID=UPI00355A1E5B|nr:WASH complex subunit 3 [Histomonas meleagridis]KAH0806118.1 WASH complex subunit 3 [Histomonas meleagridis]
MDDPIDYSNADSIGYARIIASVNQFAERTVDFLNRFSNICDLKLLEVSERINNVEILTAILEKKLQSIEDLNFTPGQRIEPTAPPVPQEEVQTPSVPQAPPPPSPQPPAETDSQPQNEENQAETTEENVPYSPRNDPLYARWFRLKDIGVPIMSLAKNMEAEGLDPNVLREGKPPDPREQELGL